MSSFDLRVAAGELSREDKSILGCLVECPWNLLFCDVSANWELVDGGCDGREFSEGSESA